MTIGLEILGVGKDERVERARAWLDKLADEALQVGDRTLVFGRPATVLADIDCRSLDAADIPDVKRRIQAAIGGEDAAPAAPVAGERDPAR